MAYQPPRCECGQKLVASVTAIVWPGIKANGTLKQAKTANFPTKRAQSLICSSHLCRAVYRVELDQRERIVRGVKDNPLGRHKPDLEGR